MQTTAKLLIFIGILWIIAGIFWQFGGKFLHLGHLPGDIVIAKGNTRIYFPMMTCLLLSVVVSAILYLLRFLDK